MTITILHSFVGAANSGRIPYGNLTVHEGVLYGTTVYGGPPYDKPPSNPANKGNLFRLNLDGSGFRVLHEFTGGNGDGWKPWSGLCVYDGFVHGSTVYGGPHGEQGGTLFEIRTDGSAFRLLHTFGDSGDGITASTAPIRLGSSLFGLTRWGGFGSGTIYSFDLASQAYRQLHRFAADGRDGRFPLGTLTPANDGYLYGLTWQGGRLGLGTLFRIHPDGSGFQTLHHFAGGSLGKFPFDTPLFDGDHTLFGTTLGDYGKGGDLGTLWKFDLGSLSFSVLHRFTGGSASSAKPNGSLALSLDRRTLYGTTHGDSAWGGTEFGCLFQIRPDASGFQVLHRFTRWSGDTPMRTPLVLNNSLLGMAAFGGSNNYGTIWRYWLE